MKSSPFRRLAALLLVPEPKSRVVGFARNDDVAIAAIEGELRGCPVRS